MSDETEVSVRTTFQGDNNSHIAGNIMQRTYINGVLKEISEAKEAQYYEALIKLGWIPPKEAKKRNRFLWLFKRKR